MSDPVGPLLQDLLRQHGQTQLVVAKRLSRSAGYVSEHTNGFRPPSLDLIETVAAVCGMTLPAILRHLADRLDANERSRC